MILFRHEISQDHVVKGSCDRVNHHHANVGGNRHCDSGDIMVLVSLREKCRNTEFFLVRIFLYLD